MNLQTSNVHSAYASRLPRRGQFLLARQVVEIFDASISSGSEHSADARYRPKLSPLSLSAFAYSLNVCSHLGDYPYLLVTV